MTIKIDYNNLDIWEKNYLGIETLKNKGKLFFYLKFLNSNNFKKLNGDIVEAGVYKGTSLISSALLIKNQKTIKRKKVWGYDTFEGFPKVSELDQPRKFDVLYKKNFIQKNHYMQFLKLKKYHTLLKSKKINTANISTSNNFENANLEILKKKIKLLKIKKNVKLIKGEFKFTMIYEKNLPKKISGGIIDCDLFDGYKISLKNFWPRLSVNGKLFLDEYYSLKFPGPRFAINEFVKQNRNAKLIKEGITLGFERWSLKKLF
jgi:hypothetical protein